MNQDTNNLNNNTENNNQTINNIPQQPQVINPSVSEVNQVQGPIVEPVIQPSMNNHIQPQPEAPVVEETVNNQVDNSIENKKSNNKKSLVPLIIILLLIILGLAGYIVYDKFFVSNHGNNNIASNNDYMMNSVVTVKSFEIDSAKVVNAPNYHMSIDGKFVLEGNYDDYLNVYFYGYCYDVDNNKYNIVAPSIGHKYDIGENSLDASEVFDYDYGKIYDIYTDNSDKKEWNDIKFKSCRFDKMTTTISRNGKTFQISEDISFDRTWN